MLKQSIYQTQYAANAADGFHQFTMNRNYHNAYIQLPLLPHLIFFHSCVSTIISAFFVSISQGWKYKYMFRILNRHCWISFLSCYMSEEFNSTRVVSTQNWKWDENYWIFEQNFKWRRSRLKWVKSKEKIIFEFTSFY